MPDEKYVREVVDPNGKEYTVDVSPDAAGGSRVNVRDNARGIVFQTGGPPVTLTQALDEAAHREPQRQKRMAPDPVNVFLEKLTLGLQERGYTVKREGPDREDSELER